MEQIPRSSYLRLSSGRAFYASCSVIGIDPFQPKDIHDGYDGTIRDTTADPNAPGSEDYLPLTAPERIEIAEFMIKAWHTIKTNAQNDAAEELKQWNE